MASGGRGPVRVRDQVGVGGRWGSETRWESRAGEGQRPGGGRGPMRVRGRVGVGGR